MSVRTLTTALSASVELSSSQNPGHGSAILAHCSIAASKVIRIRSSRSLSVIAHTSHKTEQLLGLIAGVLQQIAFPILGHSGAEIFVGFDDRFQRRNKRALLTI